MKTLLVCAVMAIVTGAAGGNVAAAASTDPVIGTWQLDAAKSRFNSGPTIKNQTRTYSQSGKEITLEMKTVTADGKEVTVHTTYRLNGKSFPVTGAADYDSISAHKISSHSARFTLKKEGKVVGSSSRTVSKDGKTLTSRARIKMANGEKADYVLVFEKQ